MLTSDNYFKSIASIDMDSLPAVLKKGHEFVAKATNNGKMWTAYQSSSTIKNTIDAYFKKLDAHLKENHKSIPRAVPKAEKVKEATIAKRTAPQTVKDRKANGKTKNEHVAFSERITEELRFIRRYINMDGKEKSRSQLLSFINALQKAIVEKRIRKTSAFKSQIEYIQEMLIKTFNAMGAAVTVKINSKTLADFRAILDSHKVYPSVSYIKKYINLVRYNGSEKIKAKAGNLLKQLEFAIEKGIITSKDQYSGLVKKLIGKLKKFAVGQTSLLMYERAELNGLDQIVSGCNCVGSGLNGLAGIDTDLVADAAILDEADTGQEEDTVTIINSMDFANMQFKTIGLKGKWYNLIGDPSPGFTAMVFGKPKMGKSYLCIDFAGYLARNHGRVLYVAKEEGIEDTLQRKMNETQVQHPNLTFANGIPDSFEGFDYIFLDSVTRLKQTPEDLEQMERQNPGKSFIYVFQSTKSGAARGTNEYMHDVDVVIEVPQRGHAVQNGRFNQGGEMRFLNKQ